MAAAQSIYFNTVNLTMTGTAQALLVPDLVSTMTLHASGGDVTIDTAEHNAASSSVPFTLTSGSYMSISNRNLQRSTFYVNGLAAVVLEILYEFGDS